MIYINVRGNIGNQLFEYACARKLQEETKQTICLNIYDLNKYHKDYKFHLLGYKLNSNVIIEKDKPIPFWFNLRNPILKLFRKIFPNLYFDVMKQFGNYVWLGNTYKELPHKNFKNYYIDGYFQSERYFKSILDIILEEFSPKEKPNENNNEFFQRITDSNSVCISIRRGDYISNEKYKKKFFVCDEQYFYRAIEEIKKMVKNPVFFVFSDDVGWAKNNFLLKDKAYYESGTDSVYEKLRLMSACKNFILSNSSFSWWAQELSRCENKIVLGPSMWYTNGEKTDIYQDNWKIIDVMKG